MKTDKNSVKFTPYHLDYHHMFTTYAQCTVYGYAILGGGGTYRKTTTSSTISIMRSTTATTAMGAMITAGSRGLFITADNHNTQTLMKLYNVYKYHPSASILPKHT